MLSDVFGSPVYQLEVCEAAALGGAYLGLHSTHQQDGISFHSRLATAPGYRLAANPDPKCKEVRLPTFQSRGASCEFKEFAVWTIFTIHRLRFWYIKKVLGLTGDVIPLVVFRSYWERYPFGCC